MGSYRKVSSHERALALLMRREMNYSYRKIALKTKLSKSTIFDIVKNEEQRKKNNYTKQQQKSKGGRPELLTAHDKRKLHLSFKKLRCRSKFYDKGSGTKQWYWFKVSKL